MGDWYDVPQSEAMTVLSDCLLAGADGGHNMYAQARDAALLERAQPGYFTQGQIDSLLAREAAKLAALSTWTYGGPLSEGMAGRVPLDFHADEGIPDVAQNPTWRKRMYTSLVERARLYPSVGMFAAWLRSEAMRLARHRTGSDTALALIYAELYADCMSDYGLAQFYPDALPGNTARDMVQLATYAAQRINEARDIRKAQRDAWASKLGTKRPPSSRKRRTR